jgi:uncharacterized protein involved in oxidation of intracellular sulfur
MSSILFVGTHGSDDPTMATFPFELAVGAAKEGHEAKVALLGEAVTMMRNPVADELHGFGCPPFRQVMAEVIEYGIPVYV